MCILSGETPQFIHLPFLRKLQGDLLHYNKRLNQERGGMGFGKQKKCVGNSQDGTEGKSEYDS